MHPDRVKEIASMGGRAGHAAGTSHTFSSDEAHIAGKRGAEMRKAAAKMDADCLHAAVYPPGVDVNPRDELVKAIKAGIKYGLTNKLILKVLQRSLNPKYQSPWSEQALKDAIRIIRFEVDGTA